MIAWDDILAKGVALDDHLPVNIYKGNTKVAGWHSQTVSGEGTISLDGAYNVPPDALVIDGKCEQTVGVWGTNLVTNGDFSNGTTGWTADFSTKAALDNELILTFTSDSLNSARLYQLIGSIAGHKYYVRGNVLRSNNNTVALILGGTLGGSIACVANQYTTFSFVVAPASVTSLSIYINAVTVGEIVKLKRILAIDLTAAFGAGNEPTAEQMDAYLAQYPNSWFDGSALLTTSGTPNSPSPTYPAPITSITGDLTITTTGKNLANISAAAISGKNQWMTNQPVFSADSISLKISDNYGGDYFFFNSIPRQASVVISWFSETPSKQTANNGARPLLKLFDAGGTLITDLATSGLSASIWLYNTYYKAFLMVNSVYNDGATINTKVATLSSSVASAVVGFSFTYTTAEVTLTAKKFQLELGSTATAYEPYTGDTVVTPLGSVELCSPPDGTKDTYDAVTGVVTKRVGKYVGASGTSWEIADAATNASFISDKIQPGTLAGQTLTSPSACAPTVYYKLATPTTIQLTPDLPVVRTGIKTLSVSANITPSFTATVKAMDD